MQKYSVNRMYEALATFGPTLLNSFTENVTFETFANAIAVENETFLSIRKNE